MIAGVVHHQQEALGRIAVHQQVLQEFAEGLAVFHRHGQGGHVIGVPVVGPDEMMVVAKVRRGRDLHRQPPFSPALAQRKA